MSENPALEAHEHAEHAAEERDPFINQVSVSIAVLAVMTAVVGSLEVTESSGAIVASSHAVLAQDRATDAWSAYQAASLKKHLYDVGAGLAPAKAADFARSGAKFVADQTGYRTQAGAQERAREAALEESERHERRHHRLTVAATLLQIAIAICTVAIITRKRIFWWGSLALAAGGLAAVAWSFAG